MVYYNWMIINSYRCLFRYRWFDSNYKNLCASIGSARTKFGTGHLSFDPRPVERYSPVHTIEPSLKINQYLTFSHDPTTACIAYLGTSVSIADVSDQNVLAVAFIGQRSAAVSLVVKWMRLLGWRNGSSFHSCIRLCKFYLVAYFPYVSSSIQFNSRDSDCLYIHLRA